MSKLGGEQGVSDAALATDAAPEAAPATAKDTKRKKKPVTVKDVTTAIDPGPVVEGCPMVFVIEPGKRACPRMITLIPAVKAINIRGSAEDRGALVADFKKVTGDPNVRICDVRNLRGVQRGNLPYTPVEASQAMQALEHFQRGLILTWEDFGRVRTRDFTILEAQRKLREEMIAEDEAKHGKLGHVERAERYGGGPAPEGAGPRTGRPADFGVDFAKLGRLHENDAPPSGDDEGEGGENEPL